MEKQKTADKDLEKVREFMKLLSGLSSEELLQIKSVMLGVQIAKQTAPTPPAEQTHDKPA